MSLNLNELLNEFPHISLATESENDELLAFYHQTELAAKESAVIYNRGDNFFAFLKERSEKFFVFTLRDDQKKLQGVAVISFRPGYINGELQTVGYLGDLRVALNRKLIREWRKFYGVFLEKSPLLPETNHCRYYQTVLMTTNAYSKNNLAQSKIPNLFYKELASYQMINIIGKFGKFNSSYKIHSAISSEKEELLNVLEADHKTRYFGHDWSRELDHRLNLWNKFSLEDHIVVINAEGKMIAATSVWNPGKNKQIIVPKIPILYKVIGKTAALLPGLTLKPLPVAGEPIDILYINQISFSPGLSTDEKSKILRGIIELVFTRKFNMLAYCDFDRDHLTKDIRGLITQKNRMGFYSVHYKNQKGEIRDELNLKKEMSTPAFDMALV
jgi:hypothetical protein